jgi:hypothetical protein
MNIQTARKIVGSQIPKCPIAPEWMGVTVSTWRGNGEVVRAFHNVNGGVTLKVKYPNGSGYTFTHLVTVI